MLVSRPCYFCSAAQNRLILEEDTDHRLGRPIIPEGTYRLIRCLSCQCLYIDSDVTDLHLSGLYVSETISSVAKIGVSHPQLVKLRLHEFERHWRIMRTFRSPTAGDRLLDVGCQTGEFGSVPQRFGVVPDGMELSKEYAAIAQRAWGPASRVYSSSSDPGLVAGQYAYVTAFETLEHLVDPISMLLQLRAWLRPGGIIALSVPSALYFRAKATAVKALRATPYPRRVASRALDMRPVPHLHVYTPSPKACALALERAGLRPIYMGPTGWHGPLQRLNAAASAVAHATSERVIFSPSILALAVAA